MSYIPQDPQNPQRFPDHDEIARWASLYIVRAGLVTLVLFAVFWAGRASAADLRWTHPAPDEVVEFQVLTGSSGPGMWGANVESVTAAQWRLEDGIYHYTTERSGEFFVAIVAVNASGIPSAESNILQVGDGSGGGEVEPGEGGGPVLIPDPTCPECLECSTPEPAPCVPPAEPDPTNPSLEVLEVLGQVEVIDCRPAEFREGDAYQGAAMKLRQAGLELARRGNCRVWLKLLEGGE